ncbi:MAG TPA: PIN domain-containing protein [Candidatus Sulfotelmatobacter sp.]|nr:PIN domain-containing protein [Candidatus Sulfotelmatobacter sp.]
MTHLLDTSALLAHYLAEPGATRVQALFEDATAVTGTSIVALFEFEIRLHQLGVDPATRMAETNRYRALLSEIVNVDEAVRTEAVRLRTGATARASAMDTLIAATASLRGATLVHRDPHFMVIPAAMLKQEALPPK